MVFEQILVGTAASACNIAIHAFIMVRLVHVARKTSTMFALWPSLRLVTAMTGTVSALMGSHASEVIVWSFVYAIVGAAPAGTDLTHFNRRTKGNSAKRTTAGIISSFPSMMRAGKDWAFVRSQRSDDPDLGQMATQNIEQLRRLRH